MQTKPIPIRMSVGLLAEIRVAARDMEMSDQDAMRFCMRLGLKVLELAEFDTATPVTEKALSFNNISAKELLQGVERRPRKP